MEQSPSLEDNGF